MRESGWYKVKFTFFDEYEIAFYDSSFEEFVRSGLSGEYKESNMLEVREMVMAPSGEMVYHNQEHNPVYNTKQEG